MRTASPPEVLSPTRVMGLEVDSEGTILWRLDSTYRTAALGVKRAMLYRAQRVDQLP